MRVIWVHRDWLRPDQGKAGRVTVDGEWGKIGIPVHPFQPYPPTLLQIRLSASGLRLAAFT